MSHKGNMGEALKESIEAIYKDVRYRKALVERFYFNNNKYYSDNYSWETVLHVKMTLFLLSCVWMGYISGLFLHYTWKDRSEWSYIETWAIWYVMFRFGYVYGYNTERWLKRVELGDFDRTILNEPGSSNDNPIDLTNEETTTTPTETTTTPTETTKEETQSKSSDDEEIEETVDDDKDSTQNISGVESVEI